MSLFAAQGNARTFDYQAGDIGYVPASYGHYIENTGNTTLKFLEIYKTGNLFLTHWRCGADLACGCRRSFPGCQLEPVVGADSSGAGEGAFGHLGRDHPASEQDQTDRRRPLHPCSELRCRRSAAEYILRAVLSSRDIVLVSCRNTSVCRQC